MQFHRLAAFIIGLWLGGSVLMDFVATQNFLTVSRVMGSLDLRVVEGSRAVGGPEQTRFLLRHFAGEANRYLFEQWEWAELMIGLVLLLALLFGRSYQKVALALCVGMIIIVAVQRFKVTPAITSWGRQIDFSNTKSERFNFYHAIYGYLEIGKLLLGLAITGILLIRRQSNRKTFVREYQNVN